MKKKITHPDGTVVEYEGTPEELAKLEEQISGSGRKDESKDGGRRLLNEEIMQALGDLAEKQKESSPLQPILPMPCPCPCCRKVHVRRNRDRWPVDPVYPKITWGADVRSDTWTYDGPLPKTYCGPSGLA